MRRYGMTAREVNAFDEMFQMLFSAVSEEKQQEASQRLLGPSTGIGRSPQRLGDLAAHLRHRSKTLRWSNEADQELDRKKEGMDKCTTDQQLLAWAMREVFGESIPPLSSTKALTGHSLGAASVHEAIYSLLMLRDGFIAGSANIETLDPRCEDFPIARESRDADLRTVMSNSFGFGGTNASLVLRRAG